jgi:hypothetical protein
VGRVLSTDRLQRQTVISQFSLRARNGGERDVPQLPHLAPTAATLARMLMPLH